MPNGGTEDPFYLTREIWRARPRVMGTLGGGLAGGGVTGAGFGAGIGMMVGGVTGGVAGAGIGLAIGTVLGTITIAANKLKESMTRLERVTRNLIEQYKAFSPVIARLRHQWILTDRQLNRAWAQTIAPTLKKLTDIGIEFKERWTWMKIEFFQAIEPHLDNLLSFFRTVGRATIWLTSQLLKLLEGLIRGLTKLLDLLGLLPEERTKRRIAESFMPRGLEWPTVEGPLAGAMRRYGLVGPPFTGERRDPVVPPQPSEDWLAATSETAGEHLDAAFEEGLITEEEREEARDLLKVKWYEVMPPLAIWRIIKHIRGAKRIGKKARERVESGERVSEGKDVGINVNVNVADSKELSAAFERVWRQANYELRKWEADNMYQTYLTQQQGAYI